MKRRSADEDASDFVAQRFIEYRSDPVRFASEFLGASLWSGQREVLEAIRDHPRVAVPAGHGLGKGFVASVASWWWKTVFEPSKVVVLSAGGRQAERVLGAEIRSRFEEMTRKYSPEEMEFLGLGHEPTATGWERDPQNFMVWFSTRADDTNEHATKATGWHSPHLLMILDEAGGIAKPVWSAIQGNLAGSHRRLVAFGNPNDPTSEFARFCRRSDVKVVRLDAMDFPNVKLKRRVLPYGPDVDWIDEMARLWGRDSGAFGWKVRGLFATAAVDSLITHDEVSTALGRAPTAGCMHSVADVAVGCDVARFGDDRTCVLSVCFNCNAILDVEVRHGQDTMATVGLVIAVAVRRGLSPDLARRVSIDDTGLGAAVTDRLRELGWGRVNAENFGAGPKRETNEEKFLNRRTELWWGLRAWVRASAALADLDREVADTLRDEMTSPKYAHMSDSRLRLEAKDEIKKRLGRSPDYCDALALAVSAGSKRRASSSSGTRTETRTKYDEADELSEALQRGEKWATRKIALDGCVPDPRKEHPGRVLRDW